jgi:hypothetical protein
MSSPEAAKAAKASKSGKSAKPAKVDKPVAKSASSRSRAADGEVFAGEDKVNFVKALWEGVPSKEAKTSKSKSKSKSKAKDQKPKDEKPKAEKSKAEKPKASKSKAPEVEILRKISAPAPVVSRQTPESDQALALVALLEAKFEAGELDVLTPQATQALVAVICRIYSANQESGNKYPLLSGRSVVSGTDAMITCSALLKAVDLQVFELGMWQSWSGV